MADFDQDGIPDGIDKNPTVFDKTPQNGGNRVVNGQNQPAYGAGTYGTAAYNANQGIQPVAFLDIVGIDPTDAKQWFKYANTNPAYKAAYDSFKNNVARLGLPTDKKTLQGIWNDAVDWTQTTGTNNGDPFNYLESLDPSNYRGGDTGPKYGTSAFKTTNITEYSGSTAAQQISDEMERSLGRRASQAEIDAYTQGVNAASMKEPSVAEGTTTTSAPKGKNTMGSSVTNQKSKTGFDPTMFARNFAMAQPDYAESFAAKNFLKLVEGLLTGPAVGEVVGNGR